MKTEFKAKFLQHVAKRKREEGFTLIELLVVIIIIGILSAIALPSFLNQANKAKQSEAKQYLSSINKGLQAFYAENSKFKTTAGDFVEVNDLGIGLKTQTTNYKYDLFEEDLNAKPGAVAKAGPVTTALRGYASAVALIEAGEADTTTTILCEQKLTGDAEYDTTAVDSPIIKGSDETAVLACTDNQSEVTK